MAIGLFLLKKIADNFKSAGHARSLDLPEGEGPAEDDVADADGDGAGVVSSAPDDDSVSGVVATVGAALTEVGKCPACDRCQNNHPPAANVNTTPINNTNPRGKPPSPAAGFKVPGG